MRTTVVRPWSDAIRVEIFSMSARFRSAPDSSPFAGWPVRSLHILTIPTLAREAFASSAYDSSSRVPCVSRLVGQLALLFQPQMPVHVYVSAFSVNHKGPVSVKRFLAKSCDFTLSPMPLENVVARETRCS